MSRKLVFMVGLLTGLVIVLAAAGYVFRENINDALGCWAYAEQCHAQRIEGLSEEECHDRGDMVAYLLEQKTCLVREP